MAGNEKTKKENQVIPEPTKIFYDILFDYKYLKYIFKYGFYWDDDITMFLLSKSSQRVRELAKTISKSVYENCVSTLWCEYANSGLKKKSKRRIVRQNHYRLRPNRWFQDLCGCCGNYYDSKAEKKIKKCRADAQEGKAGGYWSYNDCKEAEDSCVCRKLCIFEEERETFLELLDGISLRDKSIWKANVTHESVMDYYKDIIIEKNSVGICLKENAWSSESRKFADMICFLSGFVPLSALGWIFYKRQRYGDGTSYIMIRNLPVEFEFEQEYIYRCLYAIDKKKTVIYEEKEYIPIRLFYKDRSLTGIAEHLYLEAIPWKEQGTDSKVEKLPLFGGTHVRPGGRTVREPLSSKKKEEEDIREFQVEFYYNSDTEYLVERRSEGWKDCIIDTQRVAGIKVMESPYYQNRNRWNIDMVIYHIKISDIPGFLMFIRSFGDFAKLLSREDVFSEIKPNMSVRQKGYISEHESLLSVYNSDALIEMAKKRNQYLPPRQIELQWLDFVVEEYPGFCKMFLGDNDYGELRKKLKKEYPDSERQDSRWFDRERFDYKSRVKDLEERQWKKYGEILNVIYNGQILQYVYHDRQVRVLPYALEYDVTRHLAGGSREPMDIMCYDLDEKRTVNIPYKKINASHRISKEDYNFSCLEKMYHILAYAMRCAIENIQEI